MKVFDSLCSIIWVRGICLMLVVLPVSKEVCEVCALLKVDTMRIKKTVLGIGMLSIHQAQVYSDGGCYWCY